MLSQKSLVSAFFFVVLASLGSPSDIASAAPICLVGRDTTLYRFNADGNGLMEEFPNQPGNIVGMTLVPADASVIGCATGDVLAVEGGGTRRVWRVDGASCGTPSLVPVGNLSNAVNSITFVHGRLYGIGSASNFAEFDTTTFQLTGNIINLGPNVGACGMSFDGTNTWYVLGSTDSLYKFFDPPTNGALQEVGPTGIDVGDCGLEYFGGVLWGAFRGPGANLYVGSFNLATGAFTTVWSRAQTGTNSLGMVMLPERSSVHGDMNCDYQVNGLDIGSFVLALTNPSAFAATLPGCNRLNADQNGDCTVTTDDISLFVNALLGT